MTRVNPPKLLVREQGENHDHNENTIRGFEISKTKMLQPFYGIPTP